MNNWVRHLAFSNIRKHRKRNIFSVASLIVGLTSSFLIIGFSTNAKTSIKNECYKQFDYGSLTITKENKSESTNGGLSVIRNTRPNYYEIKSMQQTLSMFEVELNLSSLVPNYSTLIYKNEELKDYSYEPIYSYEGNYINRSILIEGKLPYVDSLNYIIINEIAYKSFINKYKITPIGKKINIYHQCEYPYYLNDENNTVVSDYFIYSQEAEVIGVVKDLSFLSTPKIYYPYLALKDYLSTVYLNNLSTHLKMDYSWIDRIDESNGSDPINSYSYRLFLKDINKVNEIENYINKIKTPFVLESASQTRTDALINLIDAATAGMGMFLVIALVGSALIIGIVSFSFYSEDRKVIAILSSLGAKSGNINDIYCLENMMIGASSFLISVVISIPLQLLVNSLVEKNMGYKNIVSIPFKEFIGIPFGLPLIVLASTLLVSILSTLLPISFSKKISLKEELKDE